MKDSLGIIGGVGSQATVYFFNMIIENTKVEKDQDHINMIILNHAKIPDRTSYLLDGSKKNPLNDLIKDAKILESLGCKEITIPCNTSFAFYKEIQASVNIKVNNLILDTCYYIKENNIKKVYILATTGTIKTGLYQKYLSLNNIEYRIPNEEIQDKIMKLIYNYIKLGKNINKILWHNIIEDIRQDEYVILGCTELSILKSLLSLDNRYIDPLYIESIKIIKSFNKTIKENT